MYWFISNPGLSYKKNPTSSELEKSLQKSISQGIDTKTCLGVQLNLSSKNIRNMHHV